MLSRLATLPSRTPSAEPIATSVARPRAVDVMGATTTACNRFATRDRVNTTTGRILSFGTSAHQTSPLAIALSTFARRKERHDIVGNGTVVDVERRGLGRPTGRQTSEVGVALVWLLAERLVFGLALSAFKKRAKGEIDEFRIREAGLAASRRKPIVVHRSRDPRAHGMNHSMSRAMRWPRSPIR